MSPIEQKVTVLLAELAGFAPVEARPFPPTTSEPSDRGDTGVGRSRPDYPVEPIDAARRTASGARRRRALAAAAVVVVVAVLGGLLVLGRGGRSPVSVSEAGLPVDTDALGPGRMAVVVENDLYVADGPTGRVLRLTDTGTGEEVSHVAFSHDGEWVAFTVHDESGLWISRWDGSEHHRLGRAPSSYSWSPTDDQLAYATQDQVRVAQTDGSSRALEVSAAPLPFTRVVWSPAGTGVAFVHVGGGTTREALDDTAAPEWESTYTVPAQEVLAWPSAEKLVVSVPGDAGGSQVAVALMSSVETRPLLDVADGGVDVVGQIVAGIRRDRGGVSWCDLAALTCTPLPSSPGVSYLTAVLSPDGGQVAEVVGVSSATNLWVGAIGSDHTVVLGHLDDGSPGSIEIDGISYGVEPEPPVWIGTGALLARVDGQRIERFEVDTGLTRTVLDGPRFRPPADDYPGGTGLAYWGPT